MTDQIMLTKLLNVHIIFLGPPGSGKGTQCKRLRSELGLAHLSTGDILRHGIGDGRKECLEAQTYIDKGNLVPDDLMVSIIKERIRQPDCHKGFVLDGFPRTLPQAESLDNLMTQMSLLLNRVFYLVVSEELILERTAGRLSCGNAKCGAVYHAKYSPPKISGICDVCGNPLQQRSDDRPDIVKERLKVYNELTAPLIDYYENRKILVEIDGSRGRDEIYADIMRHLETSIRAGGR